MRARPKKEAATRGMGRVRLCAGWLAGAQVPLCSADGDEARPRQHRQAAQAGRAGQRRHRKQHLRGVCVRVWPGELLRVASSLCNCTIDHHQRQVILYPQATHSCPFHICTNLVRLTALLYQVTPHSTKGPLPHYPYSTHYLPTLLPLPSSPLVTMAVASDAVTANAGGANDALAGVSVSETTTVGVEGAAATQEKKEKKPPADAKKVCSSMRQQRAPDGLRSKTDRSSKDSRQDS